MDTHLVIGNHQEISRVLPQMGIRVYPLDTGGDSFAIAVSDHNLSAE